MKSVQLLGRGEEASAAARLASKGSAQAARIEFPAQAFVDQSFIDQAVWGAGPVRESIDVRGHRTSNHHNQPGETDLLFADSLNPEFCPSWRQSK